ncbi:hypothetical protein Nepgr_009814 [Nepenthes gracilis]|uniref:RCC1-like domain-containing protein n=1 Tax=Nepenthes gracilis TaxID=150966 RepID=A0AAD3SBZ2_NEPGR|nr:hypothetical protein Nepgr_009814 [Nepenthes gracilis]
MNITAALRRRCASIGTHGTLSSSFRCFRSSRKTTTKPPILWKSEATDPHDALTVELFSWGRGSSGQLGAGAEEMSIYPTPVASILLPSSFCLSPSPGSLNLSSSKSASTSHSVEVGISCGLFHSSLLVDGKFWIWGKGEGGRLGFGHEDAAFVPTLNPHLDNVKCMALGGLHSVALSAPGRVHTWGYGGFGALGHCVYTRELVPRLVEGSWSGKIKHIATSGTHTAAITESGELYTWGRDEGEGRLGLGPGRGPDQAGGLSVPSKVNALPVPVAAVSCGGFSTMVLTDDGQLWNWGANSNYELGRGDKVGGWQPRPVYALEGVRTIQIACGGYHSLALTEDGEVLSWGHGGHGQLGHSSIQNCKIPTRIEAIADDHVVSIACGGSSSAAVTGSGKLYMWGNAKDCQLGVPGLPQIQPSPVEVQFLMEDDNAGPYKVLSVAVGASHAMCLASRSRH